MRLHWNDLGTARAEKADGKTVELSGFPLTLLPTGSADHFLMMAEPGCCQGCVPANRLAVVEIFADQPLRLGTGPVRLTGTWQVASDPDGWRYQLRGAALKPGVTRRALMAASPLFCLPVPALAQAADGMAVDIHSHAGNLDPDELRPRPVLARSPSRCARAACRRSAWPLCPTRRPSSSADGRLRPSRDPRPGELYDVHPARLRAAARARPRAGHADHQDVGGARRRAGQPALPRRLVGGRRLPRGQDRAPRRGLPALGAAPSAAHALPAERAGRHPDRTQRPWRSHGRSAPR